MRTWRILAQVITCDFCFLSRRALHGVHSPWSHRSVVRCGGHMRCPCVYCLCLAGGYRFQPKRLCNHWSTANQRRTQTRILSPSSVSRTPAIEGQYSFYRMGWLIPESEHTTEIKFPPCVRFEPTTSWSTVQFVTTELPPLSRLPYGTCPATGNSVSLLKSQQC